jgi:hypothetical protein
LTTVDDQICRSKATGRAELPERVKSKGKRFRGKKKPKPKRKRR